MNIETQLNKALKAQNEYEVHLVFDKIYLEYAKLIYFKILEYTKDSNVSEDLMQDVFVGFYNSINNTKIRNIKYYLLTSAKNKAINYLKSSDSNTIVFEDYILDLEANEDNHNIEYKDILSKMKTILTDFEIKIVLSHTLDNISFKTLSKIYGKSINSILTTYYRAIRKVKEVIKNEESRYNH